MENIKESLIRNDLKNIIKRTIFFNILFIGLLIILCFWNKTFIILVWIPIFPYIYIWKRKKFLKNAEFCYGVVDNVKLSNNGDVYVYTKIKFIDCYSNKTYEVIMEEHWGDFIEDTKDKMNEFYEECKKKKVPLFYKKENPDKNIVFINNLEV